MPLALPVSQVLGDHCVESKQGGCHGRILPSNNLHAPFGSGSLGIGHRSLVPGLERPNICQFAGACVLLRWPCLVPLAPLQDIHMHVCSHTHG